MQGHSSPPHTTKKPSLMAQTVENLPAMQETWVRSLGQEHSLEKGRQPTPIFLPGEFHEPRNLAGYSPWSQVLGHD